MPYSSINPSKSGHTISKVRKFSTSSVRHEKSTVAVNRRMNFCRMSTSDSCRVSERLAGGADIEEVESQVEDLENPMEVSALEKHVSVDERSLGRKLSEEKSVEPEFLERQSGERESADRQSAERPSADRQSAERSSVDRQSAERPSVDRQSVERQSMDRRSSDRRSEEQKIFDQRTASESKDPCLDGNPILPAGGPCCFCASLGTTGDRKVDDLIDYVHKNLQEAGKALASLGENFEHDAKLMYADLLARLQQWIATVQSKLAATENDIELLRKELIARMCDLANKEREIANLKAQLAECVAAKENCEKTLAEKLAELANQLAARASMAKEGGKDDTVQAFANAAVQSSGKDKDRLKREADLEAEIACLRKEIERLVRERAEYESAIQRALLRGVSSLNVEALKVLRCPPIPCCSPCAPCPRSKNGHDSVIPCDARTKEKEPKTCCGQRRACKIRNGREQDSTVMKRPCATTCCTGRSSNHKSSLDNGMVFVLHQGDVGNLCQPEHSRVCGEVKKIDISPCTRDSLVSCDDGAAQNNQQHVSVCCMPRRNSYNGKNNGNRQCCGVPKRSSNICFPRVSSREFIDDLVLSFCGTREPEIPPVCGEPIMKRVAIPPCPRFSRF